MEDEIHITPGNIPQGGPDLIDCVDPTALGDPMTAIAACYKCVTRLGSVEQLRDIQLCRSVNCEVWSYREKALQKIGPGK